MRELLALAEEAARRAGTVIMPRYGKVEVDFKGDGSPITEADRASHLVICDLLAPSGMRIVSEEGDGLHLDAQRYWLVDPLDGTKDFLACNNEFTVNIALIEDGRAVLGVIFAPALGELFAGGPKFGCIHEKDGLRTRVPNIPENARPRMAISRFHDHPDIGLFAAANGIAETVPTGSSLKFGRLAIAEADVLPRLVGSSEWDTAAGQALLEGAGGKVLDWATGQTLLYGKPRRRNPRLLSLRAPYRYENFVLQHYETDIE